MNLPHTDRPLFALALRIGGIAMISTMFMLAKLVGQSGVALPEMMFWRQLVPVIVLFEMWTASVFAMLTM